MAKKFRALLILAVVAIIFTMGAGTLLAADGTLPVGGDFRGPGYYLSWIKILAFWLVFLAWVHSNNWVSIDAQELKLNYQRWNPIVFGTFMAAIVLAWLIPVFWVGIGLLIVAYAAPLTAYVVARNKQVDNNLPRVDPRASPLLVCDQGQHDGDEDRGREARSARGRRPVTLSARGGPDEPTNNARLLRARQSPGLLTAREIVADGLAGRSTAIMLDYTQQAVAVRTMVDGVWIPREATDRESGDAALESLKLLCGLNSTDRQTRQTGTFFADYDSVRYSAVLTSQGTANGERVLLQFEDQKVRFKSLDELGMRAKVQEQLLDLLRAEQGFVLFSAAPANGLRSTTDVTLHTCDRYIREFATLEEEGSPYPPVENIPVTTYNVLEGQSPADLLPRVFRTEPNVVVVRDLVNAETVSLMCKEIADNRLMISTIRAKDCAEALLRVLALGVPPAEFAKAVTGVICQRLVRKLCDSCKEAYAPPAQVLQQLGIPEGRVQAFYRPPQPNPEEPKEPCTVCGGIGYLGRTAIFELLVVGDNVRKALKTNSKLDIVRQAARKDGMKNFQEEGILLVVRGVTSLPELMRVLKA